MLGTGGRELSRDIRAPGKRVTQEIRVQLPFRLYLRLVGASVLLGRSQQSIVAEALEAWVAKNVEEAYQNAEAELEG